MLVHDDTLYIERERDQVHTLLYIYIYIYIYITLTINEGQTACLHVLTFLPLGMQIS